MFLATDMTRSHTGPWQCAGINPVIEDKELLSLHCIQTPDLSQHVANQPAIVIAWL